MAELATMTLREAIAAKDQPSDCIVVPFDALWTRTGKRVRVTAVLSRTAVFEDDRPFERHLDLQERFEVGDLEWREQSPRAAVNMRRGSAARGRQAGTANNSARASRRGWQGDGFRRTKAAK